MTNDEVMAVVDAHLKRLMWETQTQAWSVTVELGAPDGDEAWVAQVTRFTDYQRALITIDPARHDDEDEVIDSLRHELLHVVLAPFDIFEGVAHDLVTNGAGRLALQRVWRAAVEGAVLNLERMLDHGHKVDPFPARSFPVREAGAPVDVTA